MIKRLIAFGVLALFAIQLKAQNPIKRIYVFFTNDIYGQIGEQKARFLNPNFPPVLGGGASAATVINKIRHQAAQNGDVVLLLDAGDILSDRSDLVRNSKGKAIIDYMNEIGYDAFAPGIIDFDVMGKAFLNLAPLARFPFVSANLTADDSIPLPQNLKPFVILEKQGIKIGILGITSQATEFIDDAEKIRGLHFLKERDAAQRTVDYLREQKCDLVIALSNLGLPYDAQEYYPIIQDMERQKIVKRSFLNSMELAHFVKGIDLIFSSHGRRGYREPWEDPLTHTLCFQNYSSGGNLGVVVLKMDASDKALIGYEFLSRDGSLLLLTEDEFWPDAQMAAFIDSLQVAYHTNPKEIIGYTLVTLARSSQGESPLGDLMADAMLEASGADFAFNNYNSMRQTIPIGPITRQDIIDAFPFANKITVVKVTGALLKNLIERSVVGSYMGVAIAGGKVVYDPKRPNGKRVVQFFVQGKPLDAQKTYRVAVSEYLAEGNSGMVPLSFLPESAFERLNVFVREAVIDYIKKHSPINIMPDGRWKRK